MSFDVMGRKVLDYDICTYDGSRLQFRGPKPDLSKPYVAFLGSTETFGKFIADPFATRLERHLPASSANLGLVNGGLDAYLNDETVLSVAKDAALRVIQIPGALNLSNHYFKVHPRRNDRLTKVTDALRALYPEVDFTEFNFTRAMFRRLERNGPERYEMIFRELQDIWLARMTLLLGRLGGPTVLMWLADTPPPQKIAAPADDPLLIDAGMIGRVRSLASTYVEIVADTAALDQGTEGMFYGTIEEAAAAQVYGPAVHEQIALALQEPCLHLLRA